VVDTGNWTILGDNPLAHALRNVARYVDAPGPITLATQPGETPDDAYAIGPAVLSSSVEHVVPYFSAFEAVEAIALTLNAGDAGSVYGCFTSFRIQRGSSSDDVALRCLLPALGVTLDLLPSPVTRVHASRASLLTADDAWFVTLRHTDDTIATIEALAVLDPAAGLARDLLVEVTASGRVLRAEPMRQSVVVEPLGAAATIHPWWEDLNERFLKLLVARAQQPAGSAGSRIRAVWAAVKQSADTGEAVSIDPM
jgi:hypothetical protein